MSRMQNILEKAERDGALRRVRPTETAAAMPLSSPAIMPPASVMSPAVAPATLADDEVVVPAADAPIGPRVVTGVVLNPLLIAASAPSSAAAEEYRALRTRLVHADIGAPAHVVAVSSAARGEGKSITAANLALTIGQEFQRRVCLVDANLRQARVHELFGIGDAPGLSDVLVGRATLDEALVTLEDYNITLLPVGGSQAHPAELLGSGAMRRLVETLRSQFDRVIIDAPSAAPLADVGILAPIVDGVLLVVRSGVTTKPALHAAVGAVGSAKLLGMVLNEAAE